MDTALLEAFALADDRAEVVQRLLPGTEERAWLECLLHQQRGETEAAAKVLAANRQRGGSGWEQLRLHQQLLEATPTRPDALLTLRQGANLDHRGERPGQASPLPTRLPAISLVTVALSHARQHRDSGVQALTDVGVLRLLDEPDLEPSIRSALLGRTQLPRHPRLLDHLVADLGKDPARRFGAVQVHRWLTAEQLDALAERVPEVTQSNAFVQRRLELLAHDELGHPRDEDERIDRQLALVASRPASFKAMHVALLRERIRLRWRRGQADTDALATYVALTAPTGGAKGARERTVVEPSAVDDTLDRVLAAALVADDTRFEGQFSPDFLRQRRAEARLLAGDDPARWASHLSPARLLELQQRVELAFAPDTPARFAPDAAVTLGLDVKNVDTLTIRIFHIDALAYFHARGADVAADIDLDGFVPNHERRLPLDRPAAVRHRVALALPEVSAPGTYVVDLVGGGQSCRAVLRKGHLRVVERAGAAGTVLTVLDEAGRPAPGATVWLGERAFETDAHGHTTLPFSTRAGQRTVLVQRGAVTSLRRVTLHAESYELEASFHVDREDLVPGAEARLLVRARLTAAGALADPSLLDDTRLFLTAKRGDVSIDRTYRDLTLSTDGELLLTFTCPENIDDLRFVLTGQVMGLDGAPKRLAAVGHLSPGASPGGSIASLHLLDEPSGWSVLALGRAGEPVTGAPVDVSLRTRISSLQRTVHLRTDDRGRVTLGPLPEAAALSASLHGRPGVQVSESWSLERRAASYPGEIHLGEGESLRLPRPVDDLAPAQAASLFACLSPLVDISNRTPVSDQSSRLTVDDDTVTSGPLPAGDYVLHLPGAGALVVVRVASGASVGGWWLDGRRRLGPSPAMPPVLRVQRDGDSLRIVATGASARARVHIFASTFAHPLPDLSLTRLEPRVAQGTDSLAVNDYTSARTLGDEARYILARRHSARPAGNLLPRPGLLLNPWSVGESHQQAERLRKDENFKKRSAEGDMLAGGAASYDSLSADRGGPSPPPRLDFLSRQSLVLANQPLDPDGSLTLPLAALGGHGVVQILLVDGTSRRTVACQQSVAPTSWQPRPLVYRSPLDREAHYRMLGDATELVAGQSLVLDGTFRLYDSLDAAWSLLESLDPSQLCARLEFLRSWSDLDEDRKRRHFSDHACHELCFFLSRKDPAFFASVVRPYLAHKHHLTFLDAYLLDHDLREWATPSRRSRLNALERVLLAGRLGELDDEQRALADEIDAAGHDHELADRLLRAALRSDALEVEPDPAMAPVAVAGPGGAYAMRGGGPAAARSMPAPRPGAPPAGAARKRAAAPRRAREESDDLDAESEDESPSPDELDETMNSPASLRQETFDAALEAQADVTRRVATRALYQPLGPTREYAERFYLGRRLHEAGPAIAPPNLFWRDLAAHRGSAPFVSPHFVRATDGSAALLLALACLDLPLTPAPHRIERDAAGRTVLHAAGPVIVFHERLAAVRPDDTAPAIVVQRYLDGTYADAPEARSELLAGRPYLAQVIVSNLSPATRQLDLLRLLPDGSLPLADPRPVRLNRLALGPYQTTSLELPFYFPHPGSFAHHPPQLSDDGHPAGAAPSRTLTVVREPSSVDDTTWEHVSQIADDDEVLAYLDAHNLHTLDLERIAWRLRERAFYDRALALLERRRVYSPALWAYALLHQDAPRAAEFVRQRGLPDHAPLALHTPWIDLDPEREALYEHLDYAPLVNPRVHGPAGSGRRIQSERLAAQIERCLLRLCSRPSLDDGDRLALVVYLLLQDRLDDARAQLARIDGERIREKLPLAYVRAYLALTDDPAAARTIALAHVDHPVDRWRDRFREVLAQLDEIESGVATVVDPTDRDQRQGQLAATSPSLELRADASGVTLHHRHAPLITLGFYEMDIEMLFSQKPFALQSFRERPPLSPTRSVTLSPDPGAGSSSVPIPASLRGRPVLVEARSGEARATIAHTSGALVVQLAEAYGHLRVSHAATGAALPRVYVKVYALGSDGVERFHRDGYTDPRGRFDYASVSTDAPPPRRFALLLLSDEHGAALREVAAPVG